MTSKLKTITGLSNLIEKAEIISSKLDPYSEYTIISKREIFNENKGVINIQIEEEYKEYVDWNKEVRNSSLIDYLPENFFKGERINISRPRSYKIHSNSDDWRKERELVKNENRDYLKRIESELNWQTETLRRVKDELISKNVTHKNEEKSKKYSNANEDILLKTLGIKIKGNYVLRGEEKREVNPTDKALIYFLYFKSIKNADECFSLKDLSKAKEIKQSERYIKNRITYINQTVKKIISQSLKLKISRFIKNESRRGYHLNPKILLIKPKK